MENDKFYCVYMHVCKENNKIYVGITNRSIEQRWGNNGAQYLRKYKDSRYMHPIFARALNKYKDWDNDWNHIIFAENLSEHEAKHFEKLLIALYKTNVCRYGGDFGYNCTDGGEGIAGYKMSEETKRKIGDGNRGKAITEEQRKARSEVRKGRKHTAETKQKISQLHRMGRYKIGLTMCFAQYSKDGKIVKSYLSIIDAERETGISGSAISNCINGRSQSAGNFIWKYTDINNIPNSIEPYKSKRSITKTNEHCVSVVQYSKNKVFIQKWNSMTEAANALNIGINNIWKCCKHIDGRKTAGGFIWEYDNALA